MRAVKAVQIFYQPSEDVLKLLEAFRGMVNYCIHVGLEKNVTSRFKLSNLAYHKLVECSLHSWYTLSAIEVAASILKNYRKAKRKNGNVKMPYARKLMAKIGNQGYKIEGDKLRIPIKPKQYFYVKLHKRALEFLSDATLKLGSVTLTARMVVLTFVKTAEVAEPKGYVAYDVNEKSIDGASIKDGKLTFKSYDLSEISRIRHGYFERARRVQAKYSNDRRVRTKILRKYFGNQNRKVNAILHKVSSEIVKDAKANGQAIILENLKHIRNAVNRKVLAVNRFNGKVQLISERSKKLKRRLNSWSFRKLQRYIEYKANWKGVKVIYVKSHNTSRICAICGCKMKDPKAKFLECCGINRHLNAALNVLKTQDERVRFALNRSPVELMPSPLNKARKRWREVASVTEPGQEAHFFRSSFRSSISTSLQPFHVV